MLSVVESEFINQSNVYLLIQNQKEKVECIPHENLPDFYPLQECQTVDGNLIVLKHAIVDNFLI